MLRIYDEVLSIVREVAPLLEKLRAKKPSLGDQGERALSSVPLQIAEGSYSRGGNRAVRYHSGAGSMQETLGVFDTAAAFGYIAPLDPALRDRMQRVVAALYKNAR